MRPDRRPIRKVNAAGLSGAAAVLALWLAEATIGDVPVPVAAAVTALMSAGAGYVTPSPRPPTAAPDKTVLGPVGG